MISSEVVKDSISPAKIRLTTLKLKYPRFIHAEFLTHRVFSRNSSSSRARPTQKIIKEIRNDWAKPLKFEKNIKGMQGGDPFSDKDQKELFNIWMEAKESAIQSASKLHNLGVHKQYVNRILEPFAHISVVVSSTEWENFFSLRRHKDAQPEIRLLADKIYESIRNSIPEKLEQGYWHLPFVDKSDNFFNSLENLIKRSVAKCARVSYNNHDGTETTLEQDLKLFDRLVKSKPLHASPAEHQAMAVSDKNIKSGNFTGWLQYRKTLENVK